MINVIFQSNVINNCTNNVNLFLYLFFLLLLNYKFVIFSIQLYFTMFKHSQTKLIFFLILFDILLIF